MYVNKKKTIYFGISLFTLNEQREFTLNEQREFTLNEQQVFSVLNHQVLVKVYLLLQLQVRV